MIQHDDLRILIIPIESCAEPFYHLDQSSSGICWDLARVRRLHCYWPSAHSIVSWTFRMQSLAASSLQSHFIIIAQQITTVQGSLPMRTNATHALQLSCWKVIKSLVYHELSPVWHLSPVLVSFYKSCYEFCQSVKHVIKQFWPCSARVMQQLALEGRLELESWSDILWTCWNCIGWLAGFELKLKRFGWRGAFLQLRPLHRHPQLLHLCL